MRLANAQSGVLSREQVLSFDVSRHIIARLLNDDRWRMIDRGIYLTLPVEPSWLALAWAGILIGGVGARLGPNASGFLYKLVELEPIPVDVLVPVARYAQRHGPWHFHRERAGARSASTHGSLPRLDVEATVLELCAKSTEGEIVGLISTAVQRRLTTPGRLSKALAARRRQRHRRLINDLLRDVAVGAESRLEVSYLRKVERAHGLPDGNRQRRRHGLPYFTDVGYDDYALLIELDGRVGHEGTDRFRDMERDNRFALVDWTTLRYGWYDVVERPCEVAAQVAQPPDVQGLARNTYPLPSLRSLAFLIVQDPTGTIRLKPAH